MVSCASDGYIIFEVIGVQSQRKITFGIGILAVLTTVGLDATSVAQSGPRLVLSQRDWDFGQIWTGEPCKIEIELKNIGDAPLKILNIKSSCGCTAAEPSKRELAPGETDTMTVTYDTNKNTKLVKQTITLQTNDPVEPEIQFELRGEVWNVFDAQPNAALSFGRVQPTSKKSKAIILTNNLKEKVTPKLGPIPPGAPFDVKLVEVEPGMKYRLYAQTKPPLKLGNNQFFIMIETGVERLPEMKIGVSARAMPRISVWPESLRVVPSQKKPGMRTVSINHPDGQPLEITEIKCGLPSVRIQRMSSQRPSAYSEFAAEQIRVHVPAFKDFPETGTTLEIYTNDADPKFQKLVVPIDKVYPEREKAKQNREP